MAKKPGVTINLEDSLATKGRQIQPGPGHNSGGIESVLAPRNSAREGLEAYPPNSGGRLDSNVPAPTTRHVLSNTVKGERFHAGHPDTHGGMNGMPGGPTIGLEGNRPAMDAPVPRSAEHPYLRARSKAAEIAHADPHMGLGEKPAGVLDRD